MSSVTKYRPTCKSLTKQRILLEGKKQKARRVDRRQPIRRDSFSPLSSFISSLFPVSLSMSCSVAQIGLALRPSLTLHLLSAYWDYRFAPSLLTHSNFAIHPRTAKLELYESQIPVHSANYRWEIHILELCPYCTQRCLSCHYHKTCNHLHSIYIVFSTIDYVEMI